MVSQNENTKAMTSAKQELLARWKKGAAAVAQEPMVAVTDRTEVLISPDQYRLWLHQSMNPKETTYHETFSLEFGDYLHLNVLQESINEFLQLHDAWRTTFELVGEKVYQRVHEKVPSKLMVVDLTDVPANERDAVDLQLSTANARRPFDMEHGPLFRFLLVRMGRHCTRLHLAIHHAIFDGASARDIFAPQLAEIYAAKLAGEPSESKRYHLQYADYTAWREKRLESPQVQRMAEFWRARFQGEFSPAALPLDRPRPVTRSYRGSVEPFDLPVEMLGRLQEMGRMYGATLNMVLLATLKVLLYRYSNQQNIVVGTAASGRRRAELQNVLGYMVETVPVFTKASSEASFASFLKDVKQSLLESVSAAEVPFDRIVQVADVRYDSSCHPLFQTFFSFISPAGPLPAGWRMLPKRIDVGSSKFDLYIEIEEREEGGAGTVFFNTGIFDRSTIQRLIGHWKMLMEAACREPQQELGLMHLLTAREYHNTLHKWNDTAADLPATTVCGLIEAQVRRTPQAKAVTSGAQTLTYAQLDAAADKVAAHLRGINVGRGDLVALYVDRSERMPIALLGIMKTGAAYVPLDPKAPKERVALCLEDAAPAAVLTEGSMEAGLPKGYRTVRLEDALLSADVPRMHSHKEPEDLCYVIHTSGSTGRPKGVELTHRSVVNLLLSMQREPGFAATDRLLAVTTISFDIAMLEMFLPLISGGRLIVADYATTRDPFALAQLIDSSKCTVMQATPATWRSLLAMGWTGKQNLKALCGGEAMTRDLADKLVERGLELWNVYGPTETTIWSTAYRVTADQGTVAIGRPIANTTAFVLDGRMQPVPVGVQGELYLGGDGLARGYRGLPEMTASKFVRAEISQGKFLYRTGDYALYKQDGTLVCLGRTDNQVKIRGHRIEMEEVELHLNAHPAVNLGAVRVWPDERAGGHRMSGYATLKPGKQLNAGELREFLRRKLPEYMVPTDFMVLDSMPMTSNGKIDRKSLPMIEQVSAATEENEDPFSETETRIAEIWKDVLGVKQVARKDNFFDMGGHSLLLVVFFSRINKAFGANLPITTIFDTPTFGEFAATLNKTDDVKSIVAVREKGTKAPLFIVHSYLIYLALNKALSEDQPIYGLRELESDGPETIEQRALRYAQLIRTVQADGPYHLAGWCAAGPLTVEVAKALREMGQEVASTILFDAWVPGYAESLKHAANAPRGLGKIKANAKRMREMLGRQPLQQLPRVFVRAAHRRVKFSVDFMMIKNLKKVTFVANKLGMPLPQFMYNTTMQTFAAFREYQPAPVDVSVTLIRAEETRRIPGGEDHCGWGPIATRGVDMVFAPGSHESMFKEPHLARTGALISTALAGVRLGKISVKAAGPTIAAVSEVA